jgi:hypothetical protein
MTREKQSRLKQVATICLSLRKRADYLLNNEPENLTVEDLDQMAQELEEMARLVDELVEEEESTSKN